MVRLFYYILGQDHVVETEIGVSEQHNREFLNIFSTHFFMELVRIDQFFPTDYQDESLPSHEDGQLVIRLAPAISNIIEPFNNDIVYILKFSAEFDWREL